MEGKVRCKGLMLRNKLELLDELYGLPAHRLAPHLSTELREGLARGRVARDDWYPIRWLGELHAAAAALTGRGEAVARRLGAAGAVRNFRTVHRAFLSVVSPVALVARVPRILAAYFDRGRSEVAHADGRSAIILLSEYPGFDRYTWQAIAGTAEALLALCRVGEVDVRLVLGADPSHGELRAGWSRRLGPRRRPNEAAPR